MHYPYVGNGFEGASQTSGDRGVLHKYGTICMILVEVPLKAADVVSHQPSANPRVQPIHVVPIFTLAEKGK